MGKGGKPHWDTIIFDAPSSGHALSSAADAVCGPETFGESLVGREAHHIGALLRDRDACGLVAVTTPEPLAITETIETCAELDAARPAGIRRLSQSPQPHLLLRRRSDPLKNSAAVRARREHAQYLTDVAAAGLQQATEARRALRLLQSKVKSPIITLPDFNSFSGAALLARITAELSSEPRDTSAAT